MAEGASLTVMAGPMAGTALVIEDAVDEILIGSDPECRLSLDLPGVSPIHARVWRDLAGMTVYDTRSPQGVYVNDERVVGEARLRDGDVLWLGAPGDPDSVMIQCRLPEEGILGAPVGGAVPENLSELPEVAAQPVAEQPVESYEDLVGETPDPPFEPQLVEPAVDPAPDTQAIAGDFALDPDWAGSELAEEPRAEPPPPLDLDSLLDEEVPAEAIPAIPPEPAATPPEPAAAPAAVAPVPVPAPAPATTPAPPPAPPMPPPRASIRREAPEGVMDWARGNAVPDEPSAAPPIRPVAPRSSKMPDRPRRRPLLAIGLALIALLALAGGYFAWSASRTPTIAGVSPARVAAGDVITLTGSHLGDSPAETSVTIGGRPARVTQAGGGRVQVEVPELPATPGRDGSFPVVVKTGGRASNAGTVAVYTAPRLKTLAPEVGMPGDNIVLTGTALGAGATVRFGETEAQVAQAGDGSLTVTVPPLAVAQGTEVPVVVSMGADASNALALVVGKVPLVTAIEPRSVSPGDLVTVKGRGFAAQLAGNVVKVGGVPALVVNASARGIEFVVPRVTGGGETVTITVAGSPNVVQEELSIAPPAEPVGFHFVAEPFEDVSGHEHAALSTALGPAFILTTAQGKSAAERAFDAQKKFNDAAQVLRSTRTAEIRARYAPAPAVYLFPRDTVLLEVTAADAEGYNEDWAPGRAKVGPVTPARLATWWEAVSRDLVLLLLRGEKPTHAQALAPEGKVLADLHDAARRTVAVGVPSALVTGARPPMRAGLRAIALRVPAGVDAPVAAIDGTAPASAAPGLPPLKLDGSWRGSETENGVRKPITVSFSGGSGTLTYERALSMSVPVTGVQQQAKGGVRFEVRVGAGTRYYRGQWDGARITGKLSPDPEGGASTGTFELDPAR